MNDKLFSQILVWDAPVRVFHGLLALSFLGAFITAESERWRLIHVTLGYTVGALVVFRILWGLFGTRHARFADFVRGPRAIAAYLRSLVQGHPAHQTGHNPAGAVAIVLLLGIGGFTALTGWAVYTDMGGEWLEEVHEFSANLMMLVVLVHVAGVVVASWLHRENLARSMVTGRKQGLAQEAIPRAWGVLAAGLLLAVLAFWYSQWQSAPQGDAISAPTTQGGAKYRSNDEKDDD